MGRSTYSHEKLELKKRPWTREEDQKLLAYIEEHGYGRWRSLPAKAGLQRCGKSCRLRWKNYLRPGIKRGKFSLQEEKTIIHLHALLGNRWSAIATHLPKRTDNEIKNYWNTHLKKRLTKMGIDPVTHKPQSFSDGQSKDAANLSHMTQWESARLEAEARLVRQSNLQLRHNAAIPPPVSLAAPPVPPPMPQCLDVLKVWKGTTNSTLFNSAIGSLESPTSTLILSMDLCSNPTTEFINGNTSVTNMISIQESGAGGVGTPNNFLDQVMENSMLLHDENNVAGSVHDLLPISDGYNMTSTYGDFEENKNYWNDILNLVTSST